MSNKVKYSSRYVNDVEWRYQVSRLYAPAVGEIAILKRMAYGFTFKGVDL